jgi:hypothetical protein
MITLVSIVALGFFLGIRQCLLFATTPAHREINNIAAAISPIVDASCA